MPEKKTKTKAEPKKEKMRPEQTPGFATRIAVSMLTFFALIIFFIVWLFFYADTFTLFQNIAIVLVGILAAVAVWGAAWISWGIKYGFDEECCHCAEHKKKG